MASSNENNDNNDIIGQSDNKFKSDFKNTSNYQTPIASPNRKPNEIIFEVR